MANTPQWTALILKVAESWGDGTRKDVHDLTDRSVIQVIAQQLVDGKAISDKQKQALLASIRTRIGREYKDFDWPHTIALTKRQRLYARSNKFLEKLGDKFIPPAGPAETCDALVANLSPVCSELVTHLSPTCDTLVANLLPTCNENGENVSVLKTLPALTIQYDTIQNETERNDTEFVCGSPTSREQVVSAILSRASQVAIKGPSDALATSRPMSAHARSLPLTSHVPVLAMEVVGPEVRAQQASAILDQIKVERQRPRAPAATPPAPPQQAQQPQEDDDYEVSAANFARMQQHAIEELQEAERRLIQQIANIKPGLRGLGKSKPIIKLWQDARNRVTGEVNVAGTTYWVDFGHFMGMEERMYNARRSELDGVWWQEITNTHLREVKHYAKHRRMGIRRTDMDVCLSPLLDSRFDGRVAHPNCAVLLLWSGNQVAGIAIINGMDEPALNEVKPNPRKSAGSNAADYIAG